MRAAGENYDPSATRTPPIRKGSPDTKNSLSRSPTNGALITNGTTIQRHSSAKTNMRASIDKKASHLESIANEYMKQDSYRRSQNKYGLDLTADEIAEDEPEPLGESNRSSLNSSAGSEVPLSVFSSIIGGLAPEGADPDAYDDGYFTGTEKQLEEPALCSPEPPKQIRWQKGGIIGSGAFGRVCLGLNLDTGELLAVKQVTLVGKDDSSKEIEAFEQEVAVMRGLNHENIVRYYGTSQEEGVLNIFLEYVPGGSISSLLAKFGCFSEKVIRVYTRQILHGLDYLHRHKIVHRDIKCANILVDNNGVVKLADFGASKRLEGLVNASNGMQSLKGTPYYMAPEVIKQLGHGRQADIWSVGCTVYEMFTGRPPWHEFQDQVSALFHIASTEVPPPIPDSVPAEVKDFLGLCFIRDSRKRPTATRLLQHPFVRATNTAPAAGLGLSRSGSWIKNTPRVRALSNVPISPVSAPPVSNHSHSHSTRNSPQNSRPGTPKKSPAVKPPMLPSPTSSHPPTLQRSQSPPSKELLSATLPTTLHSINGNMIEEPSWGGPDQNRRNLNWVESKLKQTSAANSPSNSISSKLSQRRASIGTATILESDYSDDEQSARNLKGEKIDERTITNFVRKSAVMETKLLVKDTPLMQSIKDFGLLKSVSKSELDDEEIVTALIKTSDKARDGPPTRRKPPPKLSSIPHINNNTFPQANTTPGVSPKQQPLQPISDWYQEFAKELETAKKQSPKKSPKSPKPPHM